MWKFSTALAVHVNDKRQSGSQINGKQYTQRLVDSDVQFKCGSMGLEGVAEIHTILEVKFGTLH